ncbi:hypothetical protein [Hydrogenophaga sp.]|uniref:hypothetical protein n=1 Tax=Hydrogenophaga sp. TaxID=1904254 RepID=UPI00271DCFDF|nr:hypothetical protein [Hydrogenophaga sp.]MDO9606008.1 hypothetical protein [Hydrogenophaga sp.]
METKSFQEAGQAQTPGQKQAYKSPSLHVYGAVHQFTQGTNTALTNDAGGNMGGVVKM